MNQNKTRSIKAFSFLEICYQTIALRVYCDKKTAGFIKLTFLKRSDSEFTYFKLLTFWTDLKVITNFTGPNLEEALFYDNDRQYLIDFPGIVSHFEVFSE